MNKIKTSELIKKLALASEEACKCEDENFLRATESINYTNDSITVNDAVTLILAATDFSRFSNMRAICKVLQELDLIENDIDVFDNISFRSELVKTLKPTNNSSL